MRVNLTDVRIRALKPAAPGKRYVVWDQLSPLGVRVTDRGAKSFVVKIRPPGSPFATRRAIGEVGTVLLDGARNTARDWARQVKLGLDPAVESKEQKHKAAREQTLRAATTFSAVAELYIARRLPGQRKAAEVAHIIRKELIPYFGDRPLAEVKRRDVIALIDALVDRPRAPSSAGKPKTGAHARNVLTIIRSIFSWAINRDLCEASPCDRIRPKDLIGTKLVRDRVLDDHELRALWRAAGRADYPFGPLFKSLLLTGARKSEVSDAHWSEFDFEANTFAVPAERFKSNTKHVIPLTPAMLSVLDALPHFRRGSFIFSTTFGEKPVDGFSKAKKRLDRLILEELRLSRGDGALLEPWTIHDIRRTVRTRLSALCPEPVAELIVGHAKRGLARIYDQHKYLDEMRTALELWEARLRSIVEPPPTPDNVVVLHERAGA